MELRDQNIFGCYDAPRAYILGTRDLREREFVA